MRSGSSAANFWLNRPSPRFPQHGFAANSDGEIRIRFAVSNDGSHADVLDPHLPLMDETDSGLHWRTTKEALTGFSDRVRGFFSTTDSSSFRVVHHAAYSESIEPVDKKAGALLKTNLTKLRRSTRVTDLVEALMVVYLSVKGYGFIHSEDGKIGKITDFVKEGLKLIDSRSTLDMLQRVDALKVPGRMQLYVLVGINSPHSEVRNQIIENTKNESELTRVMTLAEIAADLAKLIALGSANSNELRQTYGKIYGILEAENRTNCIQMF
ncbi:hypothetical protein HYT84_03590 [Candidatus Micrarchaeota archaeon]|nr:hypothetical protein [Candidatus Micrarchaeota archaeon]